MLLTMVKLQHSLLSMSFDVTTKYQMKRKDVSPSFFSVLVLVLIDLPASVGWSDAELKRSKDAISSLSLKVKRSNVLQQTRRKPRAVNSFCWVGVAALQYELLAENARSTKSTELLKRVTLVRRFEDGLKREKVEYGFKRWILNHTDKFSISQLAPFEAHELAWVFFLDRQDEFLTGILIKGLLLFGSLIVLVSARWKSNCDSYEVTSAIGQLPKHLIRKFFSAKRQFIEQVLPKFQLRVLDKL